MPRHSLFPPTTQHNILFWQNIAAPITYSLAKKTAVTEPYDRILARSLYTITLLSISYPSPTHLSKYLFRIICEGMDAKFNISFL